MHSLATRLLCFVPCVVLTLGPMVSAQNTSGGAKPSRRPLSDYVACAFYGGDDFELRARDTLPPPAPQKLTPAQAKQLWEQVYVALSKSLDSGQYNPEVLQWFLGYYKENSTPSDLEGMTRDEANTHIQKLLADAGAAASLKYSPDIKNATDLASHSLQDIVSVVARTAVARERTNVAKGQQVPLSLNSSDAKQLSEDVQVAISKHTEFAQDYLHQIETNFQPETSKLQELPLGQVEDYFRFLAERSALSASAYPFPNALLTAALDLQKQAANDVSEVIKKDNGRLFTPPEDISCSMAVMGWKETSDIFGRRVANRYVAIQVTLRNLNTKNEFLVHDVQVAVDTGIAGEEFGRFQAGRDKLLVRAVAERGKSNDRRNVILNSLTALGAIAGASSVTAGTTEFKDAVAIFQGSFITGFANIFPDHTVEQLNHINDLVFSASNTSKVLVPVQGSVPLVTFIAERPLEQLPFAWCGHPPRKWPWRDLNWNPEQSCDFNGEYRDDTSKKEEKTGYIDDYHYRKGHGKLANGSDYEKEDGSLQKVLLKDGDNSPQPWADLHYKNWRGAAVRMLEEHTFVVVGGVHIQQVAKQGKIANLDCAGTLVSGPIDISQTKDGAVQCTVTGEALDKVNSVKLKKGTDEVAGKIKPAKDGNSATLEFDPEKLADKDGTYSLYLVDSSGAETDSGESVELSKQQPYIKNPGTLDTSTETLTLEGTNLGQISSVTLVSETNAEFTGTLQDGDTSRKVDFSGKNLPGTGDFHLKYAIKAEPTKTKDPNLVVKRAAASQGAAAQEPVAPAKQGNAKAGAKSKPAAPRKPAPATGNQPH